MQDTGGSLYAVIDTETTGLSPRYHHRIVELAVVLCDEGGNVEDVWSTLINPNRDVGATSIHGIKPKDLVDAPRFEEIAGHLFDLLRGRLLVGHNVSFDLMFLEAEYDRLTVPFPVTQDGALCTMRLASTFLPGAGRSLAECCRVADVDLTGHHCASSDATATAALLSRFVAEAEVPVPWRAVVERAQSTLWPRLGSTSFVACPRAVVDWEHESTQKSYVAGLLDFMPRVDSSDLADPYLAVLDEALADRYLSADEQGALQALGAYLKLNSRAIETLHREYLDALARVALADGVVTDAERADLHNVAALLSLPAGAAAVALDRASQGARVTAADKLPIKPGDKIVFTGEMDEPRAVWMQRSAEHGFVPHPSVTKDVRLVVAGDVTSLSGKAKKARGYGIPIMSIDDFRIALGYAKGSAIQGVDFGSQDERHWARIMADEDGSAR